MVDKPLVKKHHAVGAIVAFFSQIIRFIVIPMLILYIIIDTLAQSNITLLLSKEETDSIASYVLIFGGMVAIFAALEAYYSRGSKARMAFGIISIGMLCAWFWFILSSRTIRLSIADWNVALNITGIVAMMIFAVAMKSLIPIAQYYAARDKHATSQAIPMATAAASAPKAEVHAQPTKAESIKVVRHVQEEPPPPEDFMAVCPSCKKKIHASADVCPYCKTWIRQKRGP